jgi:uncharacterized protein YxjI
MNIDFNKLKRSIGKKLKFEATYLKADKSKFEDAFYAVLKEVNEEFIIVEQTYVVADEDYNDMVLTQKRKLIKDKYIIDTEKTPLNH